MLPIPQIPRHRLPALLVCVGLAVSSAVSFAGSSAAAISASAPSTATIQRSQFLMGTLLTVEVEAETRGAALAASERVFGAVADAESRLSTWRDDSELSLLNAAEPGRKVTLSPALATDLHLASRCVELTDGAFDPTVSPLAAAVGFAELDLEGDSARRPRDDFHLDAGGFGKGAGLDDAVAVLRSDSRVRSARLDFGGQLMLYRPESKADEIKEDETKEDETKEDTDAVRVAHPVDRDRTVAEFRVAGGSVATTGHGERPGHVLDPRSGRPAADFGSLTVWTDPSLERSATLADCLSTGLYVLGPQGALDFAQRHDGVEVLVVERHGSQLNLRASAGLADPVSHWTSHFAAVPIPDAAQTTRDDEPHASTHGSSPR